MGQVGVHWLVEKAAVENAKRGDHNAERYGKPERSNDGAPVTLPYVLETNGAPQCSAFPAVLDVVDCPLELVLG
jgi:hypothetical protein